MAEPAIRHMTLDEFLRREILRRQGSVWYSEIIRGQAAELRFSSLELRFRWRSFTRESISNPIRRAEAAS